MTSLLTRCLVGAASLCALVACEVGSDTGKTVAADASGPDATKDDVDASAPKPDAATPPIDTGAPTDAPAAESGESGTSACDYPLQCPQTRGLGTVSGDTAGDGGGNAVHATGHGSEWLSVRVTENDSSAVGRALSLTASLTTAPGTDYDIYLYVNDGSAKAECTNVASHATATGTTQLVSISWGEGTVSNGKDDSATVTVRLQHVSGPCDTSVAWSLDLTGNTQ